MLKVAISKQLPEFNLQVAFELEQEILVFFGPSGAGKSLTLGCIAGLFQPDKGHIILNGRILFKDKNQYIPRHKRKIGVVFQGYALFPHLTVAQNLAYGLRYNRRLHFNRRLHYKRQSNNSVSEMLHRLRLENLATRYPHQLSGGQQQRVALGRALIIEPQLLLLDEPFAALDQGVREHLQKDIATLQQELALTVIYVTHNLEDVFALGDKLAVFQAGQLAQIGPLKQVFNAPNSRSVAEITGVKNIWEGKVIQSEITGLVLRWGTLMIDLPPANYQVGERLIFYIRPEDIKVIRPDKPLTDLTRYNLQKGIITSITDKGIAIFMTVKVNGAPNFIQICFSLYNYQDLKLSVGQLITLSLLRHKIVVLPKK